MFQFSNSSLLTIQLALFWVGMSSGQPLPDQIRLSLDLYGDPLPPGAIARFGTVRWRADGIPIIFTASRDGRVIASSMGRTIVLWDATTGQRIRMLLPKADLYPGLRALAFSPDNQTIAAIGKDQKLRTWDVKTGEERLVISLRTLAKTRVAKPGWAFITFAGDNLLVVKDPSAMAVQVLTSTGPFVRSLAKDFEEILTGAIAPDGKTLALGTGKKEVIVLDINTGANPRVWPHSDVPRALTFTPDSKHLAVLSQRQAVIHDVTEGKVLQAIPTARDAGCLTFSSSGKQLIVGSPSRLTIRDLSNGEERWRRIENTDGLYAVQVFPDGRSVLVGAEPWNGLPSRLILLDMNEGTNRLVDVAPATPLTKLYVAPLDKEVLTIADYHPDPQPLRRWDPTTGRELGQYVENRKSRPERTEIALLAYSPDGRFLATTGRSWQLQLWDTASGNIVALRSQLIPPIEDLKFTSNGLQLFVVDPLGRVHVVDRTSWRVRRTIALFQEFQDVRIRLTEDARLAAVSSIPDRENIWHLKIQLLHVERGEELQKIELVETDYGREMLFSTDGRMLLTFGMGQTLGIWEVASGGLRRSLVSQIERYPPSHAAVSPNGRWLAVGLRNPLHGETGHLYLWDLDADMPPQQLIGHLGGIKQVAFSRDGKKLFSVADDATGLIWSIPNSPSPLASHSLEAEKLWKDLEAADVPLAHRAVRQLVARPKEAVKILEQNLRPKSPEQLDPMRLQGLIAKLDSVKFTERDSAMRLLRAALPEAIPILRQSLAAKPSLEMRQRITSLLEASKLSLHARLRALQVLELLGTSEARELLKKIADRGPTDSLGEESNAALMRLAWRPVTL